MNTITSVKDSKAALEQAITELVKQFETKNGVEVSHVDYEKRTSQVGCGVALIINRKTTVTVML